MKIEPTPSELSELFIRGFKPLDEAERIKLVKQLSDAFCSSSESFDSSESWKLQHLQDSEWRGLQLLGLLKNIAESVFIKPNYCGQITALLACIQDLKMSRQLDWRWFFVLFDGETDVYSDVFSCPSLIEALKKMDKKIRYL